MLGVNPNQSLLVAEVMQTEDNFCGWSEYTLQKFLIFLKAEETRLCSRL